jgi:hypothetical protein
VANPVSLVQRYVQLVVFIHSYFNTMHTTHTKAKPRSASVLRSFVEPVADQTLMKDTIESGCAYAVRVPEDLHRLHHLEEDRVQRVAAQARFREGTVHLRN